MESLEDHRKKDFKHVRSAADMNIWNQDLEQEMKDFVFAYGCV